MNNICTVVCSYHRTLENNGNKTILKFSEALDNFYVLFDNQQQYKKEYLIQKYNSKICLYDNTDFEINNFNRPIDARHRWGNHQNPKYFYAHFRMLIFYLKNPDMKYYWFFDDDVEFDGDINSFLNSYNNIDDDFIAIQAFKKEDYIDFPRISTINNKMLGSHGNWLNLCPGPGDNFKSYEKHIGSFFPIVRLSKEAMDYLLKLNNENYFGYSEGFVPTSLASEGFKVSSMMNEFNQFFIPNKTDCTLYHKNINFTWEWL